MKPNEGGESLTGQAVMGLSMILTHAWSGWVWRVENRQGNWQRANIMKDILGLKMANLSTEGCNQD